MTDVPAPRAHELSSSEFWTDAEQTIPNTKNIQEHFFHEGKISLADFNRLLELVIARFSTEPNLLELKAPVVVCGDIHGQFYDLVKLFEVGGHPSNHQYLFLGDYVDRGLFSVECVVLLYCFKLSNPDKFWMLRGNHECRHLTDYFTFKEEVEHKYTGSLYATLNKSFDTLPLAATINSEFLCVHGGLSPAIRKLSDIQTIHRFMEPPQTGVMCDLLWADPIEDYDEYNGPDLFQYNDVRSCSYTYTYRAVTKFLKENRLRCMIRAHEAQNEGFRMYKLLDEFPTVITLFSAPNYLDAYGNKGAIMHFDGSVMNIRQFEWSDHPYWLPRFMDVFTWSIPFVAEKIANVMHRILEIIGDEEDEELAKIESSAVTRADAIRAKIRSVGKWQARLTAMREANEHLLHTGSDGFIELPDSEKQQFEKVRERDLANERWQGGATPPNSPNPSQSLSGSLGTPALSLSSGETPLGEVISGSPISVFDDLPA
ncbi:MAG: metallophosphoesterase [archaeon]|nr:metallophosphoesterase [archaeon]